MVLASRPSSWRMKSALRPISSPDPRSPARELVDVAAQPGDLLATSLRSAKSAISLEHPLVLDVELQARLAQALQELTSGRPGPPGGPLADSASTCPRQFASRALKSVQQRFPPPSRASPRRPRSASPSAARTAGRASVGRGQAGGGPLGAGDLPEELRRGLEMDLPRVRERRQLVERGAHAAVVP
jgi:hypothetical protein